MRQRQEAEQKWAHLPQEQQHHAVYAWGEHNACTTDFWPDNENPNYPVEHMEPQPQPQPAPQQQQQQQQSQPQPAEVRREPPPAVAAQSSCSGQPLATGSDARILEGHPRDLVKGPRDERWQQMMKQSYGDRDWTALERETQFFQSDGKWRRAAETSDGRVKEVPDYVTSEGEVFGVFNLVAPAGQPLATSVGFNDDVDVVQQVRVGSDDDVTDIEREANAENSEAEDFARLRVLRAIGRKTRAHYRFRGPKGWQDRFPEPSAVGDRPQQRPPQIQRDIHWWARSVSTWVVEADIIANTEHDGKSFSFCAEFNFKAIAERHALFARLERGPVVDGRHVLPVLLNSLPDTDGNGEDEIQPHVFATRWNGDATLLLKHLFKKHEGALAEVYGEWSETKFGQPLAAPTLGKFDDPQFTVDQTQWLDARTRAGRAGTDLNIPGSRKGGKGKPPDVGGKGEQPAIGGKGGFERRWQNRVLKLTHDGGYQTRNAYVISLPRLFCKLVEWYSAQALYQYFCSLPVFAVRRQHPWASLDRRAAACLRKEETGSWGFGRS